MRNTVLILACLASPLVLTGCAKSCDDLEREMEKIGQSMATNLDRLEELGGEIEDLQEEYMDRCTPQ